MRLIDGDKLKEYIKLGIDCGGGLKELYNHFDCIPTAYDVDKVVDELINMVEDIVRRGTQEMRGWISVSEKLPENNKEVLACFGVDDYYIAWYEDGEWNTEEFVADDEYKPIAWMPIPKYTRGEIK